MFQLRKTVLLVLIIGLFLGHAYADESTQSPKTSQLQQFKKSQKCYTNSVSNEEWKLALTCAKKSLDIGRELFNSRHKNIAALTHNYALMLSNNYQYINAADAYKKALKLYEKNYGKKSETVGWLLLDKANAQVNFNPQKASKNYLKALDILSTQELFEPLIKAQISLEASIKLTGAERLTKRALNNALTMSQFAYETYFKTYGANHSETAVAILTIGKIHYLKGDNAIAEKFLTQSTKHSSTAKYADALLVEMYTKDGRSDLAKKHQESLGTVLPKRGKESKYIPVYVQSPKYPKRAMHKSLEGYAIISLTITQDGGVKDIILVEEHPVKFGFGKAALKVAKKLRYAPQIKDGKAIEVSKVLYKYNFLMP